MLERFIVLLAVAAIVFIAVLLIRTLNARNTASLQLGKPAWDHLGTQPDGRRTLVAFSTPSCAACHTAQAPAIDLATTQLGDADVRVIGVDAASQPKVARAFGILTVPSTVVIAAAGNIVAINQGFTPSTRLVEQLKQA